MGLAAPVSSPELGLGERLPWPQTPCCCWRLLTGYSGRELPSHPASQLASGGHASCLPLKAAPSGAIQGISNVHSKEVARFCPGETSLLGTVSAREEIHVGRFLWNTPTLLVHLRAGAMVKREGVIIGLQV